MNENTRTIPYTKNVKAIAETWVAHQGNAVATTRYTGNLTTVVKIRQLKSAANPFTIGTEQITHCTGIGKNVTNESKHKRYI